MVRELNQELFAAPATPMRVKGAGKVGLGGTVFMKLLSLESLFCFPVKVECVDM